MSEDDDKQKTPPHYVTLPQPGEVYVLLKITELAKRYGIHPTKSLTTLSVDDEKGVYTLRFNSDIDDGRVYGTMLKGFVAALREMNVPVSPAAERDGEFLFAKLAGLSDALDLAVAKAPPAKRSSRIG